MSRSVIQVSLPSTDIVVPADLTTFLHGYAGTEDDFLTTLIAAARDHVEGLTGYCLAPRDFVQYSDRFPMFPFTPSLAFGPLYGTAVPYFGAGPVTPYPAGFECIRNPFDLTLDRNPVLALSKIVYVDVNGAPQTLEPDTDFTADLTSIPARVTPLPKGIWPSATPGPKAVAVFYTAGYYTDPTAMTPETLPRAMGYPPILKLLVMQLAAHWYLNRDMGAVPTGINDLIIANRVVDYNPIIE